MANIDYIDVVKSAQQGDLDAYGTLVVRFQDMAYGYAYARLGDQYLAEDVAQEAFVEGFQKIGQLRHPEAWPSWLQKMVFKHCDRIWRRGSLSTLPLDEAPAVVSAESGPDAVLEEKDMKAEVHRMIRALPDDEREVVSLFYLGEYSQAEIGVFLDVSVNTVKNRLRSGRQKFKEGILRMAKQTLREDAPSKDDVFARRIYFVNACKAGEAEAVKKLLADYPNLVQESSRVSGEAFRVASRHPIHYAAREGQTEVVKVLLDAGMLMSGEVDSTIEIAQLRGFDEIAQLLEAAHRPKKDTTDWEDPIRAALMMPDRVVPQPEHLDRIFELVKEDPERVHAIDGDGNTPLHRAAEGEVPNYALIAFLLDNGADLEATNFAGRKPIHMTMWNRRGNREVGKQRLDITRYFLHKGTVMTIHFACALGDVDRVKEFLDADASLANAVDSCDALPLSYAAAYGQTEIVKVLLDAGADPNGTENANHRTYCLYIAARKNHLEIARMLLEAGAHTDAWMDGAGNAMGWALDEGFEKMADLIASYGGTAWSGYYVYQMNLPVVAEFLKLNPSGATSCLSSLNDEMLEEKNLALVRMAFKFGADAKKVRYWTIFRAQNMPSVLRELFENGVNPNIIDREGLTILHHIAQHGFGRDRRQVYNLDALDVMLEYGIDLNARDDTYQATPLAWAAMHGHLDVVKWFLDHGAKSNLPDDEAWATPLFWAEYKGHEEIVELLKEYA